jgi:hypothetical protein
METRIADLPNWTFRVDEVSAGAYRLRAQHRLGPSVEISGADPSELIERAKKEAAAMEQGLHRVNP